jgi:hypothetical protein
VKKWDSTGGSPLTKRSQVSEEVGDSTGGSPLTKRRQVSEEVGQYRRLSSNKEKPQLKLA